MKMQLSNPSIALTFLLSLLIALPLARPAYAQENASTRTHPAVGGAAGNARLVATSVPRATRPWAPPDVDDAVPPVAPDVACSLGDVLQAAGQRVKELVTNLEQFTATERIEHAEANKAGN